MSDTQAPKGSSELLGPDLLLAALKTATEATQELEGILNQACQEAFQRWHDKWQINPDSIYIKGEVVGPVANESVRFNADVKLRWELA